jgi:hypothetical protein
LLAGGAPVFHIIGPGQVKKAVMTGAARQDRSGVLTYPS